MLLKKVLKYLKPVVATHLISVIQLGNQFKEPTDFEMSKLDV